VASFPTQDLVLLGLLQDGPLHGYELKKLVEERMSQVAHIAPGTLYYTLKKLEKQSLIGHAREREGNRPERQVYSITDDGRARFTELLREAVHTDERPAWTFDAALYFYEHIDKADLLVAIEEKLDHIADFHRQLESLSTAYPGRWPFPLEALKKKGALLSDALEDWYRFLHAGVKKRQRARPTSAARKKAPAKKTSRKRSKTAPRKSAQPRS
jgi:DNA-binding PadR family transcriptional regulator